MKNQKQQNDITICIVWYGCKPENCDFAFRTMIQSYGTHVDFLMQTGKGLKLEQLTNCCYLWNSLKFPIHMLNSIFVVIQDRVLRLLYIHLNVRFGDENLSVIN